MCDLERLIVNLKFALVCKITQITLRRWPVTLSSRESANSGG